MKRIHAFLCFAIGSTVPVIAQAGPSAIPARGGEQQWQDLVSYSIRQQATGAAVNKPEAIQAAKTRAVAAYTAQADQFRAFYTANPKDAHVPEAEYREAQMLINAMDAGDTTNATRLADLISVVRKDATISSARREQLAARYEYHKLGAQQFASRTEKMAAYEQTARAFVTEFPDAPLTYASLLHVAIAAPDDRASAIANDLLQMSAPKPIQSQAQVVLDRLALKGRSLSSIADTAIGYGNVVAKAKGKPVVLYTWSYQHRDSLKLASALAAKIPTGTALIGLCLDAGSTSASVGRAATLNLAGDKIYDIHGPYGLLAQQLYLTNPGMVYIADASGSIVSVSAQHDVDAALAALGAK